MIPKEAIDVAGNILKEMVDDPKNVGVRRFGIYFIINRYESPFYFKIYIDGSMFETYEAGFRGGTLANTIDNILEEIFSYVPTLVADYRERREGVKYWINRFVRKGEFKSLDIDWSFSKKIDNYTYVTYVRWSMYKIVRNLHIDITAHISKYMVI